ncbi:hypothetical protein HOD24_02325, partial [Candidatus Peregrinibacteria bacterium]|nr:hypothetical protein [Candidatus Peregrinibacteria bacterium]
DYSSDGCEVVCSVEEAIDLAKTDDPSEIFIIGGGQIYNLFMPMAEKIYLTKVHANIDGDVYFSELSEEWKQVFAENHPADDRHKYSFTFLVLERK